MKHRNQGFDQIMQISFKQYLKKKKKDKYKRVSRP